MISNHTLKIHSGSLDTKEIQLETIIMHKFTYKRITKIKKTVTGVGKNMEKLKPANIASMDIKWLIYFGKQLGSPSSD
jgi:hypothetical protein